MIVTIKYPDVDTDGNIKLHSVADTSNLTVATNCIMAIDGSTTNTGIAIVGKSDGALHFTCACTRENNESTVRYKVKLKQFLTRVLISNSLISDVFYEEPFIGYAEAAKSLLMLRTSVEELIIENEPRLDYVKYAEINNMKWKRMFLAPDKCPQGTELQKQAVRKKLEGYLPIMSDVTQDEVDAYSMGFVAVTKLSRGEDKELESKKRLTPFQYNVDFIGADCDDDMISQLYDVCTAPKKIFENGIVLTELKGTQKFEKHLFETMADEDKLIIMKFRSDKHGDIILKHKLGRLSNEFEYIYATVWRKFRKY